MEVAISSETQGTSQADYKLSDHRKLSFVYCCTEGKGKGKFHPRTGHKRP